MHTFGVLWGGCVSEFTLLLQGGIYSVKINTPPPWKIMLLPVTMPITLFQPAIIKIIALNNGQELLVMIIEEDDASIIMRYESETLLGGSTMRAFFRANLHISLYNDTRQGWLVGLILKNYIICVAWFGSTA